MHETSIFCLNNANISDSIISQDIPKVTKHWRVQMKLQKTVNSHQSGKALEIQQNERAVDGFRYLFCF